MKPKYKYKTKRQVKPIDTKPYLVLRDGNVVESVELVKSKEVALGGSHKRQKLKDTNYYSSSDFTQNWTSARVSKDRKKSLDRGIQLHRLWFRFLKLALELESMNVSLVREKETLITNIDGTPDIPKSVKDRMQKEFAEYKEGLRQTDHSGGVNEGIFREKLIQKVKVKKSAYKDWDLDAVLDLPFNKWWETHHDLFEGHYPSILQSKDEWEDNPNFVHIRLDRTTRWGDVQNWMQEVVSKEFNGAVKRKYRISGTKPRVLVFQNNYNALVLRIKGWSNPEICDHKNIYLRNTDEVDGAKRIKGDRLTVSKTKEGKPLYSKLVSRQVNQGLHHLFEVCEGRFGTTLPTK